MNYFKFRIEYFDECNDEEKTAYGIVCAESCVEAVANTIEDFCDDKYVNRIDVAWIADGSTLTLEDLASLTDSEMGEQLKRVLEDLEAIE